jgi:hypothetical protein
MSYDSNVLFTTAFIVVLASLIAFHFFRCYRIAGLRHLLGMPTGFAFVAVSYLLVNINLWINDVTELDSVIIWISSIILSYGFSLIAVSYHYKSTSFSDSARLIKIMSIALIPLMAVSFGIVLSTPIHELIPFTMLDEYFYVFNIVALGYILIKSFKGILTDGNPKTMYIPVSYTFLLLGQLLMYNWAVNGDASNIINALLVNLAGLSLFTYTLYHFVIRSGKVAKRTAA